MPASSRSQSDRRDAIRGILLRGPAETQRSLLAELGALGFAATQSSVSRDLREIGAIKTGSGYELPGPAARGQDEVAGVSDMLREQHVAGPNLLVIRTAVGAAQRVALALDRCGWPEIVGNIGGDDTVFVATGSAGDQRNLMAKIDRAVAGH